MEPVITITITKISRHLFITQQSRVLEVEVKLATGMVLNAHYQFFTSEAYHKVHICGTNAHHHIGRIAINRYWWIVAISWLRIIRLAVINTGLAINKIVATQVMIVRMSMVMMTMVVTPARLS